MADSVITCSGLNVELFEKLRKIQLFWFSTKRTPDMLRLRLRVKKKHFLLIFTVWLELESDDDAWSFFRIKRLF